MEQSKEDVKDVNDTFETTDKKGRVLKLRKPGMLAQYRMVGMLGKAADSETYLNMCMPLLYLYAIDGDDSITINSVLQMEGLIQRLGEEGVNAIMVEVQKRFKDAMTSEAEKEAIKK
jgi:hypothetical protein